MRKVLILAAALALSACVAMNPPETRVEKFSGQQLYTRLCASCHGASAHGDGPVAPYIKTGVPDLTRIAWRDGGEFPAEDVRRMIDGRLDHPVHGTRDMPVWGWQLYDMSTKNPEAERQLVDDMIGRIVDYLQSIQTEP
jgi:mono/diheme cytochrome c family protein